VGLAVVLAGGVVIAGCSSSTPATPLPDGGSGSTSATPTPSPTRSVDPVVAAYLAYWDAVIHANATANPGDPPLARHIAGTELAAVRNSIRLNRVQGLSVRGSVTHQPRLVSTTGDSATVEDCYDTSAWSPVEIKTGKGVGSEPDNGTGRYKSRFTLRQTSGNWLVVASTPTENC
jgi:hypothetical protein